jgi:hypothetical protein
MLPPMTVVQTCQISLEMPSLRTSRIPARHTKSIQPAITTLEGWGFPSWIRQNVLSLIHPFSHDGGDDNLKQILPSSVLGGDGQAVHTHQVLLSFVNNG